MTRRGSVLVEVLISILIFTIGLVALAGTIMFSLRMVVRSGEVTQKEQNMFNAYETYMITRFMQETGTPQAPASADYKIENEGEKSITLKAGGTVRKEFNVDLYKYSLKDQKAGSEIYVIQRGN